MVAGIPWIIDASLQYLLPFLHGLLSGESMCLNFSLLIIKPVIGLGLTFIPYVLNDIASAKMLFQMGSHSQIPRVKTSTFPLGNTIQPMTQSNILIEEKYDPSYIKRKWDLNPWEQWLCLLFALFTLRLCSHNKRFYWPEAGALHWLN